MVIGAGQQQGRSVTAITVASLTLPTIVSCSRSIEQTFLRPGTDGMMYRSAYSGSSWQESGIPGEKISSMTADRVRGIIIGTADGRVSYSTDGGLLWERTDNALSGSLVLALSVDDYHRRIIAATDRGVSRTSSYVRGQWNAINSGLPP
jgi:photosystem II stability/assembly factor-like uncharacterized protein